MEVPTKELKFIHITKTAGSSIETVGLEKNKRWGIHHKEYGFWHGLFSNKPEALKKKYDWFVVVRNPYKRVLSEYHFIAKALGQADHNKIQFNSFIRKWIVNASNNKENHPTYGRVGGDHFTEQYKYLDPNVKIHILKFENMKQRLERSIESKLFIFFSTYNIILSLIVSIGNLYSRSRLYKIPLNIITKSLVAKLAIFFEHL